MTQCQQELYKDLLKDKALFYKCDSDTNDCLARTYDVFSVPGPLPCRCDAASADKDSVDEETEEVLGERASVEQRLHTLERSLAARCHPVAKDDAAWPAALREHEESARFFLAKAVRLEQHLAAVRE